MKIIECPRDAMQGIQPFIPTPQKASYLNQLLKVGFDTIDFGSFVSPKAIPQMRDTAEVLARLDRGTSHSRLLAIVANQRGATTACSFPEIDFLGFPLSMSETFQQRNTNRSISEALQVIADIQDLCVRNGKILVTYISMGFGNPYGDPYAPDLVAQFAEKLIAVGVGTISLADTVGVAEPLAIQQLFAGLTKQFPDQEFGVHLHATPASARKKIEAALSAGCQRFDGALKGFGGCPMADDELVGNIATESIVEVLEERGIPVGLDHKELVRALAMANDVFAVE